jgi:hypothetical protein
MSDRPGNRIEIRVAPLADRPSAEGGDDHLARDEHDDDVDLIETVRDRLAIDPGVSDVTIAASLAQIASRPDVRGRWLAAFGSPLGKHLAQRGGDLNDLLNTLLALAPRQQI